MKAIYLVILRCRVWFYKLSGSHKNTCLQEFLGKGKAERKAIQIAIIIAILSNSDGFDAV